MSDRELLELAAKAAGIPLEWDGNPRDWQPMYYKGKTYHAWEPLTDDGDALRLAVKLRMQIDILDRSIYALAMGGTKVCELDRADPQAAARRAVTRAAAEIGRSMS